MQRYGDMDYPKLAKRGFLLGFGLFALGALGEIAIHTAPGLASGTLETVLFDFEILGILIGLLAPLVFGVVLPLTE